MPNRIQPTLDLQGSAEGMGPAMMRLDSGSVLVNERTGLLLSGDNNVFTDCVLIEFRPVLETDKGFLTGPLPNLPLTRWQRFWNYLNRDVKDVWQDIRSFYANRTRRD